MKNWYLTPSKAGIRMLGTSIVLVCCSESTFEVKGVDVDFNPCAGFQLRYEYLLWEISFEIQRNSTLGFQHIFITFLQSDTKIRDNHSFFKLKVFDFYNNTVQVRTRLSSIRKTLLVKGNVFFRGINSQLFSSKIISTFLLCDGLTTFFDRNFAKLYQFWLVEVRCVGK